MHELADDRNPEAFDGIREGCDTRDASSGIFGRCGARSNSAQAKILTTSTYRRFDSVAAIAHLRTEACGRRLELCGPTKTCGNHQ